MSKRANRRRRVAAQIKPQALRPVGSEAYGWRLQAESTVDDLPQEPRPSISSPVQYTVVPVFEPGDPRAHLIKGPDGSPGRYRLTYVLAIPGFNVLQENVDFSAPDTAGDSLLLAPYGLREIHILCSNGIDYEVKVDINSHGRMRALSLEIQADGFAVASHLGHDLIMPILSRWSFLHDVAITTSMVRIEEMATGAQRLTQWITGALKGFTDQAGLSTPDHRALLAAYREGISSTEPLWRALSLYKVAEGVWALRQRRREAAHAAGRRFRDQTERVPNDVRGLGEEGLAISLAPYAGKKFRAAFDDIRAALRNSIAHLDPDGDPLAQDSWADMQRINAALPAMHWMSRQLLLAELRSNT